MKPSIIILYCCLLVVNLTHAQSLRSNPFVKEEHFFVSDFEEKAFKNLNDVSTPDLLLATSDCPESHKRLLEEKVNAFCRKAEGTKHKSEVAYLRYIFQEIHREYLKKYQRYATFERVLTDGSYDCLTGTLLYAMVLDRLGFPYEIHETGMHCYLKTRANYQQILFEVTDPLNGFVTSEEEIPDLEEKYSQEIPKDMRQNTGLTGYKDQNTKKTMRYYNELVDLKQAAGLHYYNQAVTLLKVQSYRNALTMLEKSYLLYPSQRILNTLLQSVDVVLGGDQLNSYEKRLYSGKKNYYNHDWIGYID